MAKIKRSVIDSLSWGLKRLYNDLKTIFYVLPVPFVTRKKSSFIKKTIDLYTLKNRLI